MKAYFENEARRKQLQAEAESWVGTPFRAHGKIKAVGVDCVWLAAKLYMATDYAKAFTPPPYTLDRSMHKEDSLIVDYVEKFAERGRKFARVNEPRIGDMVCFRIGRCEHHVGVMVSERMFVHAMPRHIVAMSLLDDATWSKRLATIFRPMI